MARIPRYLLFVVGILILLHLLFSFAHNNYQLTISRTFENIFNESRPEELAQQVTSNQTSTPARANATFVILARNTDIEGVLRSIRSVDDRFNTKHGYPYVLLNEVPFTDEFKRRVSIITESRVEFGVIPRGDWYQPDWIDEEKASKARERMKLEGVKYGDSVPYRNMCRYNSGFFYRHELLQKYKWYWRVEPDVKFHCNINEDPFLFMERNDKVYGFTIATYEISATIPSLWGHVTDFIKEHPEYVAQNNSMEFLSNTHGRTYNRCHFWSNFEIADMDFWRGEAYTAFFEHLDATGNFYYERWGDAPVHSIAAGLFLRRDQIHFFENIGYQHDDWSHCPLPDKIWEEGRCACNQRNSFDYDISSCKSIWDRLMSRSA